MNAEVIHFIIKMSEQIKCNQCGRFYKNKRSLSSHKTSVHKGEQSVGVKIHQPYEEMTNEQIAARYLNGQKEKLDADKYQELKRKIKGLKRFRPKPYDRKQLLSSDDEHPIPPMKPSNSDTENKPSTSIRYGNISDDENTSAAKNSQVTKRFFQCTVCQNKFDSKSNLMKHMNKHPKCIYCNKRYKEYKTFIRHWKSKHGRARAIQAITNGYEELNSDSEDDESEQLAITNSEEESSIETIVGDSEEDSEGSDDEVRLVGESDEDSNEDKSGDAESDDSTDSTGTVIPESNLNRDGSDNDSDNLIVEDSDDFGSDADVDLNRVDELSKRHINCVTVERFLHVRNLIRNDAFDTLVGDPDLLHALQVIIKGVLNGFIPICSSQRVVLTPELKTLMYNFSKIANPNMVVKHKVNLKILFGIIGKSVKLVVDSFNKWDI